jgi:hypothetical protein
MLPGRQLGVSDGGHARLQPREVRDVARRQVGVEVGVQLLDVGAVGWHVGVLKVSQSPWIVLVIPVEPEKQ